MNPLFLFHTARHLKASQIRHRLVHRFLPTVVRRPATLPHRAFTGSWAPSLLRTSARSGPSHFRFLNQEREIHGWNDPGLPKLWLYNLHYHECPDPGLIESWVAENPVPASGPGWDAYTLSLRIVNWLKWHLNGGTLSEAADASIAIQTTQLESVLEYDILGNHLLANAKALVFAGTVFRGHVAEHWLRKGLQILEHELPEQILPDGSHFERSPMYHSLCTEDLLDLVNLARAYPGLLPDWHKTAGRMLGWLRTALHPDGGICFFNDCALGVAPEAAAVFAYGKQIGVTECTGARGEAGYIRLANAQTTVIFDAAPIGPDYQPAHAHADTLSFELSYLGRRALVNSGTSTYEVGPSRQWQRGTSAHNTVRIDGQDSSEVWNAFRVARRAYPVGVRTDGKTFVEAAHNGYERLRRPVLHRRHLELLAHRLIVTDSIEGSGTHDIEVFFHLHPDADVQIDLGTNLTRTIESTTYHPGFNLSIPKKTIVGRYRGPCPVVFKSHVELP